MEIYKKVFKEPWPYWVGAIILALLNIILLTTTGSSWRITAGFLNWGSLFLEKIGFDPASWYYFQVYDHGLKDGETFFMNYYTIINIAIIIGGLLSVLWANEFKWKKIKSLKQFLFALGGGIIMGYGTRLSFGCNIGAYFSAIPSFSLHGWVFAIFMFVGAWIGVKILLKYII
ncbi:YeeE/YedE family protein [Alkalicella caledoniensis]|uniref:YeeE/YedE family protein n=1 Tax=Alkalicella caledoniensis TaxID=2731377 RepID=A0A7G9W9K6_ALKCA|nr:YeeE/YedE thiosulfate transporter family protein [Alkalicella caledoniensis]QNO15368.1 YeeE/YedE family protein [Alkalicella caledoniensis]